MVFANDKIRDMFSQLKGINERKAGIKKGKMTILLLFLCVQTASGHSTDHFTKPAIIHPPVFVEEYKPTTIVCRTNSSTAGSLTFFPLQWTSQSGRLETAVVRESRKHFNSSTLSNSWMQRLSNTRSDLVSDFYRNHGYLMITTYESHLTFTPTLKDNGLEFSCSLKHYTGAAFWKSHVISSTAWRGTKDNHTHEASTSWRGSKDDHKHEASPFKDKDKGKDNDKEDKEEDSSNNKGLLIGLLLLAVVTVALLVVTIGLLFYIRRLKKDQQPYNSTTPQASTTTFPPRQNPSYSHTYSIPHMDGKVYASAPLPPTDQQDPPAYVSIFPDNHYDSVSESHQTA